MVIDNNDDKDDEEEEEKSDDDAILDKWQSRAILWSGGTWLRTKKNIWSRFFKCDDCFKFALAVKFIKKVLNGTCTPLTWEEEKPWHPWGHYAPLWVLDKGPCGLIVQIKPIIKRAFLLLHWRREFGITIKVFKTNIFSPFCRPGASTWGRFAGYNTQPRHSHQHHQRWHTLWQLLWSAMPP